MKKFFVCITVCFLFIPIISSIVSESTKLNLDVKLQGHTYNTEKPRFSISNFLAGEFQEEFSQWHGETMKFGGILTKTYSTIRFNLFNLGYGDTVIGYNKDAFGQGYIDVELGINGVLDFADKENQQAMEEYIGKLIVLQDKLKAFGKVLYVCISPNKADFHSDNILKSDKGISNENSVKPVDYFSKLISKTDIPYLICRDISDELEYPAFYTTGIHWSRTYEQIATKKMIDELSELTGKNYGELILNDVTVSEIPIWRDADAFSLLNVWNKIKGIKYYQYNQALEVSEEEYDEIKLIIHGTSFSEGTEKVILDSYPNADVYLLNRSRELEELFVKTPNNEAKISTYLDNVDAILLETIEPEITAYSYGFVDLLLDFLDEYEPQYYNEEYINFFNILYNNVYNSTSLSGIYCRDNEFAWSTNHSQIILNSESIEQKGMELEILIPKLLFEQGNPSNKIEVHVNGKKVFSENYTSEYEGSIFIDQSLLPINDGLYYIDVYTEHSFKSEILHWEEKDYDLSIQLKYIGGIR